MISNSTYTYKRFLSGRGLFDYQELVKRFELPIDKIKLIWGVRKDSEAKQDNIYIPQLNGVRRI